MRSRILSKKHIIIFCAIILIPFTTKPGSATGIKFVSKAGTGTIFKKKPVLTPVWDENDLKRARSGDKNLAGANLKQANLSGLNLAKVNLTGADLSHANLRNATITKALAMGANFEGANMMGTKISDSDFYRANLTSARFMARRKDSSPQAATCSFHHADLRAAVFTRSYFAQKTNFFHAQVDKRQKQYLKQFHLYQSKTIIWSD